MGVWVSYVFGGGRTTLQIIGGAAVNVSVWPSSRSRRDFRSDSRTNL
jgi:hypothetical protein